MLQSRRISTHAPRTGSDGRNALARAARAISTHAPRTGSDVPKSSRATRRKISTHAPRTGSDGSTTTALATTFYFNPRSPHGERRKPVDQEFLNLLFQPTLPARGATRPGTADDRPLTLFQPTLPARGATPSALFGYEIEAKFQPTLPARGATTPGKERNTMTHISTHAPRTGSDRRGRHAKRARKAFQPTLPARGATRARNRRTP